MASGPITSWKIDGKTMETVRNFIFLGSKITLDSDCSYEIKTLAPWKKSYDKLRVLKSRGIILVTKVRIFKAMIFPVVMYRCEWVWEHKESWALNNWCFQTVVLEKTLESPLGCKEIKPVNPEGNQVLNIHWKDRCWSSNTLATSGEELTHWKRLRAGGEGATEDELVGWHHWLDEHEFEQNLGDSEGQEGLAGCSPWGHKESDKPEWLNNNKLKFKTSYPLLRNSTSKTLSSSYIHVFVQSYVYKD